MIDSENDMDSIQARRNALRQHMTEAFRTHHAHRQRHHRLVQLAATASVLLLALSIGWQLLQRRSTRPEIASLPDREYPTGETSPLKTPVSPSSAEMASRSRLDPSKYQHMELKLISEEELQAALIQSGSDWFLVTIDGERQAFSQTALENQPRPRRTVKN